MVMVHQSLPVIDIKIYASKVILSSVECKSLIVCMCAIIYVEMYICIHKFLTKGEESSWREVIAMVRGRIFNVFF